MSFPYSSAVLSGINAVAADHNNARKDGLTRWFKFEVVGPLAVGNKQGGSFVLPYTGTVINHRLKTTSGSATIRTNADATVIESGMSATSSASLDSSPSSPAVSALQLLTMDVLTISAAVDLVIEIEILCTP